MTKHHFASATIPLLAVMILAGEPSAFSAQKKSSASSTGAEPTTGLGAPTDAAADNNAEQVNVDTIKEKYWARGEQSELGVVQNRAYTKAHKFTLGVFGGIVATDPFLSVQNLGFSLGYNFSEYFGVSALYFKDFVSKSGALDTFERRIAETSGTSNGATTNYNEPRYYYGGEAVGSFLYGKLSVMGKAIIYYDMHLLGGLGVTSTESGNNFTQHVGIGQQVYLSKVFSLRLDYRLMHYNETLIEKVITTKLGQPVGTRSNLSNVITLGVDILFGASAKEENKK